MTGRKDKKKLLSKLLRTYRFVILNDATFREVWSRKFNRLGIYSLFIIFSLLIIAFVVSVIVYTPVKQYIPGFPTPEMTRNIQINSIKVDSLENQIRIREQYMDNIKTIISGDEPVDYTNEPGVDSVVTHEDIITDNSEEDSLLREQVRLEDDFNISYYPNESNYSAAAEIHFYPPLKGMVTSTFNPVENHYGIDVVAPKNALISSVLDGTVVFSAWTLETGYVIQIQHKNEMISTYKHNSVLLKKQGDRVSAGDAIAILGNSGEFSTGPHLHFELWYKGAPLNPADYIIF